MFLVPQWPWTPRARGATVVAVEAAMNRSSALTFQPSEEIQTQNWPSRKSLPKLLTNLMISSRDLPMQDNQTFTTPLGSLSWYQALLQKTILQVTFVINTSMWKRPVQAAGILECPTLADSLLATWLQRRWLWFWRQLKHLLILPNDSAPRAPNQFMLGQAVTNSSSSSSSSNNYNTILLHAML